MKTISATAIVALTTATLGFAALSPAMAQPAPIQPQSGHHQQVDRPGGNMRFERHGQRGGMDGITDFGRTAERMEMTLVRLAYRLDLTTEQKGLLETLRASLLDANDQFTAAAPAPVERSAEATPPTPSERLDQRIAAEEAHLAALKTVQPAFTAFFDSLTDAQKAELAPRRDAMRGQQGKPVPPIAPDAAPAPTNG